MASLLLAWGTPSCTAGASYTKTSGKAPPSSWHARQITPIVSVQNCYNLLNRDKADLVYLCEWEGLAFIPWFPLAAGAWRTSAGWRNE